jgi:hypothetical protein
MPRLTINTILARAIEPAIADRTAYVDAYNGEGPEADNARETIEGIKALVGKKFAKLNEQELDFAGQALLYAQYWEEGLADSQPNTKYARESMRKVRHFKAARHHFWGKTNVERAVETSGSISVFDLLKSIGQPNTSTPTDEPKEGQASNAARGKTQK